MVGGADPGMGWVKGCSPAAGVTPLGILLVLGWVSSKGDTASGMVGGRNLGFAYSVTSTGHVGDEFGGGQQEGIIDASAGIERRGR